jgi:hypothetical protein
MATLRHMEESKRPTRQRRDPRALTPRQESALRELLSQPTIRKAAAAANVSEAKLRQWLAVHVNFQIRYRDARRELIEGAAKYLNAVSLNAANVLWLIAHEEKHSTASRVSAARATIGLNLRCIELLDVLPRLEAIETEHLSVALQEDEA